MDFIKLLNDARQIIPNVIEYNFLYGTYDFNKVPEPKQRKERIKASQQGAVQKKELIAVAASAGNGDEENNDSVMFLYKVLQNEYQKNNNNPLKYYEFVIDSESYTATVENIFYCSFLVRDGKADLQLGK